MKESIVYDYNEEITNDEYEVLKKFLALYRNKNIIVADEFRQDFNAVPLEQNQIIFKSADTWKIIKFCRVISHNKNKYLVRLNLWHTGHLDEEHKCLSIQELCITSNDKTHYISLTTGNEEDKDILFDIISIFDERKIISPQQAYSKKMYTNKSLQEFMVNHEWQKIDKGIEQKPELANVLFIIDDFISDDNSCTVNFGTILYQLISFRMSNLKNFNDCDLNELDKLILKLSKTELLRVNLCKRIFNQKSYPKSSILLESNNLKTGINISQQYNVDNTELSEEQKHLEKCIKNLKI